MAKTNMIEQKIAFQFDLERQERKMFKSELKTARDLRGQSLLTREAFDLEIQRIMCVYGYTIRHRLYQKPLYVPIVSDNIRS